jgi:hypothetical protein
MTDLSINGPGSPSLTVRPKSPQDKQVLQLKPAVQVTTIQQAPPQVIETGTPGIGEAPLDGEQYARENGQWEIVEGIPGPKGDPGDKGDKGDKGDTGDTGPVSFPDAPIDTKVYGRKDAGWSRSVAVAGDTMTGALAIPAGSAAAPSLFFAGNPTYGFYQQSAGRRSYAAGGIEVERLGANNPALTNMIYAPQTVGSSQFTFRRDAPGTPNTNLLVLVNDNASNSVYVQNQGVGTTPEGTLKLIAGSTVVNSAVNGDIATFTGATKTSSFAGPVILAADPTVPLQAVTKQYVDALFSVSPTLRNLIDNGNFNVSQELGSTAIATGFFADRWNIFNQGTQRLSFQRATTALVDTGAVNKAVLTVTATGAPAADDLHGFYQTIENLTTAQLLYGGANAKTTVLSFFARCSVAGTYSFALRSANGTPNRSYVRTFTLAANVITRLVFVIPGDTGGTTWSLFSTSPNNQSVGDLNLFIFPGIGTTYASPTLGSWVTGNYVAAQAQTNFTAQANGSTFEVWSVQLELGSAATAFETLPFDYELRRAQRFYQPLINISPTRIAGFFSSSNFFTVGVVMPVSMRAAPAVVFSQANHFVINTVGGLYTPNGISISAAYNAAAVLAQIPGSGSGPGTFEANNANAKLFLDARI